jgi:hypothetical protein
MKKIALIAALAGLTSLSANAVDVPASFTVQVNLTSKCQIKTAAAALNFGAYTSFGSAEFSAPTTSVVFECTRGLVPTVAFDTTNGTTSATAATATGQGVLVGLRYTLSVAAATVSGATEATAGAGGSGGSIGSAQDRTYTITGGMDAAQAGTCTTPTCAGSHVRQLIVSY